MTIKERFNIRISRIKDYANYVSYCRDMERSVAQLEKDITKIVDADKVDEVFACIKHYNTTLPAVDISQIGEDVYFHTCYCHRFEQKPCPIFNCRYHKSKKAYDNQLMLLKQAKIDKQLAFKRMFERIK